MPAKKPISLIERHETKAETAARIAKAEGVTPAGNLPKSAPTRLKDHRTASAVWRRLMRIYGGLTARIVTPLDWVLVENFCLSLEELEELSNMRKTAYQTYQILNRALDLATEKGETEKVITLSERVLGAFDMVLKTDARVDNKKKLLHQLGQSLYTTPRSRAGTVPVQKPEAEPDISTQVPEGGYLWQDVIKLAEGENG